MLEERQKEEWNHTSLIVAAVANSAFGRTKTVYPSQIHPFLRERTAEPDRINVGIQILKAYLPKHKRGRITVQEVS